MRMYSGHCHCGAVRFTFRSEPIETGCRCNCSLCVRRGAVMSDSYVEPQDVLELEGTQHLQEYRFGDHMVNHYFCKLCGIYTFHDGTETPGRYRFNLGCVEGVDPYGLEIRLIDGRSF